MRVIFDHILGQAALMRLCRRHRSKRRSMLENPTIRALARAGVESLAPVREAVSKLAPFRRMVLVGIGGSSLGARLLVEAMGRPEKLLVLDNVDPDWVAKRLRRIGRSWCLLVVTKSGTTAETAALTSLLLPRLKKAHGRRWKKALCVVTDPKKGPLRAWAEKQCVPALAVPPPVPGRYSVLTPVGLLPAAFCGVRIERVVEGAASFFGVLERPAEEDPAWLAAICDHAHWRRRNICVLFVYSGRLARLRDWFVQLWAESLGKRRTTDGRLRPTGQTPIGALGVTDQHSLLQLFAEGPDDKVYTLVVSENGNRGPVIPRRSGGPPEWGYLGGRALWDLFSAEAAGTEATLLKEKRPFLKIVLEGGFEEETGRLLAFLMLRTAYLAALLSVNPFNQPGVEFAKKVARRRLGGEVVEGADS